MRVEKCDQLFICARHQRLSPAATTTSIATFAPGVLSIRTSHAVPYRLLRRSDRFLVAPVHRPALDTLRADEAGAGQNAHMFAQGRRGNSELFGNQHSADAVLDQVSVELGREMSARVLQPPQDLDAAFVRQGLEDDRGIHFYDLLISQMTK